MSKRDAIESREKILNVAEKLFSEVGFDGARVDEIARIAGVNKALIYYYFKSKDDILDVLFHRLLAAAERMVNSSFDDDLADLASQEDYKRIIGRYLDFVTTHKAIIKVAVTESIKHNPKHSIILKISELLINTEIAKIKKFYKSRGIVFPHDEQKMMIMEFFTGVMPILSYSIFLDEWRSSYGSSEEELREEFIRAYIDTHLSGHLKRAKEVKK